MSAAVTTAVRTARGSTAVRRTANRPRRSFDPREREAADCGDRFARGETGLGARLSSVPAAGFWDGSSISHPLPTVLRGELELAFDADLRSVRVHRDPAAAAAAMRLGARAFASGSAIYFGQGYFDPTSRAGRTLIAHELTHVLQQAGRATHHGRLSVQSVHSLGDPQCDALADFSAIRKAHAPAAKSDTRADFDAVAAEIERILAGPNPAADLKAFAEATIPKLKVLKWPHQAESLLFDACKDQGLYESAAALIERDNFAGGARINTLSFSGNLSETLQKNQGRGWAVFTKAIERVKWLKDYENAWLAEIQDFLLGADKGTFTLLPRSPSKPGKGTTIQDHVLEVNKNIADPGAVGDNEWIYFGLLLIYDLDLKRRNACLDIFNKAREENKDASSWSYKERRARALAVTQWGGELPKLAPELTNTMDRPGAKAIAASLQPYLRQLGDRVAEIGRKADSIFAEALSIEEIVASDGKNVRIVELLSARRDLAARLGTKSGLAPLLAELLKDLNRGAAAGGPTIKPDDFRNRAKAWNVKLRDFQVKTLAEARLASFRAAKRDEVLAFIALESFILRLRAHLIFTAESASEAGTKRAPVETTEEAAFQRYVVAQWIGSIAKALHWSGTVNAAEPILRARLEGKSQVYFRSFDDGELYKRTHMSAESMVDQAIKDARTRPIKGLEPLTLYHLTIFYRTVVLQEFTSHLRLITPASNEEEQKNIRQPDAAPYLAQQAKQRLKPELPQRWEANGVRFADNPNDNRSFSAVLSAHPEFGRFYHGHIPSGYKHIFPDDVGPWVWFIPPFRELMSLLRQSLLFRGLAASSMPNVKLADALKKQGKLADEEWFELLAAAIEKLREQPDFMKKLWPELEKELQAIVSSEFASARADFDRAFIRAMRRDRQIIARRLSAKLYRVKSNPRDYPAVKDMLQQLGEFRGINLALDDVEGGRQMALLLLEVADPLHDAMARITSFHIVFPMLGHAEPALQQARELQKFSVAQRTNWLPDHENSDQWIASRLVTLERTVAKLRSVRDSVQKSQGFQTDKSTGEIIPFVKLSSPIQTGELIVPRHGGGRRFRVKEVKKSFTFHPAYGDPSYDPKDPGGFAPMKFLAPDGSAIAETEPLLELQWVIPKPTKAGGPVLWLPHKTWTLTPKDQDIFEELYEAIIWTGFLSAMGNIQAGIQWVLEFYLDLAELLPGVGPLVAAARITEAIASFLTSADYQALIQIAKGDVISIVEGLLQALTDRVDSDQLILLLLFGDPRLDHFLARSSIGAGSEATAPQDLKGSEGFKGLKGLMTRLRRLGRAVTKRMRKLQSNVHQPMQNVRTFSSTRPLVSFTLNTVADRIFEIVKAAETIKALIARNEKTSLEEVEKNLKEQQKGLAEKIHGVMHSIESFKLPDAPIDIRPAIATALKLAEEMIIKKTGFVGKVINVALKKSGAYDFINMHFAEAIVEAGIDPNVYWREKIIPKIEGRFNEARVEFIDELNKVLKAFGGTFDQVPAPGPIQVKPDASDKFEELDERYLPGEDEPDLEPGMAPSPSSDRPLIPRPGALPRVDGGEPLPTALRRRAEVSLGQDFGHVRLHRGAVGAQMTEAFGADALTSGSHIFTRRGKLAGTLDHELAHVVQQTGSRPLGSNRDQTPVAAHPERGLDWRPADEAQADAVASAMRGTGGSRAGGAGKRRGLQPSGVNWFTIARFMREMSDVQKVLGAAEKTEGYVQKGAPTTKLPPGVQNALKNIISIVTEPVTHAKSWKGSKPLLDASKQIQSRLTNPTYLKDIEIAAQHLALDALEPSKDKFEDRHDLAATEFARELEAYLLYKTGIGVSLTLNAKKKSVAGGHDYEAVDLGNPVTHVSLLHIHLPRIDGRSPLWADAIHNTWFDPPPVKPRPPDFKEKIRKAAKELLAAKGIEVGIWPLFGGGKYRFSTIFAKEAEEYLKTLEAARPEALSWKDYVTTTQGSLASKTGLRLAHHTDSSQISSKGRQSHHLTQYLIGEFFSNKNESSKPFLAKRSYPGVFAKGKTGLAPAGAQVSKISSTAAGGGATIEVEKTAAGRGDLMPCISLAAVTHQQGKLHVTPEPDEETGRKSQGAAVDNEFRRHLSDGLKTSDENQYKAYLASKPHDEVAAEIYHAVQATYATVEHHMSKQLVANMARLEFEYYCDLVRGTLFDINDQTDDTKLTPEQKQFRDHLDKIPAIAKEFNRTKMLELGWDRTK